MEIHADAGLAGYTDFVQRARPIAHGTGKARRSPDFLIIARTGAHRMRPGRSGRARKDIRHTLAAHRGAPRHTAAHGRTPPHTAAHGRTEGTVVPRYDMKSLHGPVGFEDLWEFERRWRNPPP